MTAKEPPAFYEGEFLVVIPAACAISAFFNTQTKDYITLEELISKGRGTIFHTNQT